MRADAGHGGCHSSGGGKPAVRTRVLGEVSLWGWQRLSWGIRLSSSLTPEICSYSGRDHTSRATVPYVPTLTVFAASFSSSGSRGSLKGPW